MSDSALRPVAIGALAGLLGCILVAIPATAAAHALVLVNYQPTQFELAKATCCGQVLPGFWVQVLPHPRVFLVGTLLGLASGAAIGVFYVVVRKVVPGPTLIKAALFAIVLAMPFDIFVPANYGTPGVVGLALWSPWESVFAFSGPLGAVPQYHLPLAFRLLLALPIVAAGLAIAGFAQILDRWLPNSRASAILTGVYTLLGVIAGVGMLMLPLITGLVQLGGD